MKSAVVRETFLKFFEERGHKRVPSSSLIPAADPTLLFTNAGMVQFKDCFLGFDPGYKRAVTSQKCVRAGGKHNDLENVGVTPRHHTFFEMLGNFSFGDYFKKDAIDFAWELITKKFGIPKDRLRITIYKDDDEAFELWKAVGVNPEWIVRLGEKDNFWAMGDTGPCGPCTEIHYDWGPTVGCGKPTCQPGCECDVRFLEIWNLVFMQYNRDSSGKMEPLPKPSVDTGSGLERVSCVLQGVFSNYDTDLFQPILQAIAQKVGKPYDRGDAGVSMRVIADHLRSGTFLLSDGVIPSNEGRGYVLRRILRRAIRHGKQLGQDAPFLYSLVKEVVASLGTVYPELKKNQSLIETLFKEEEQKFHETLHRGLGLLEETISKLSAQKQKSLPGEVAFKLYDTFGFPYDLIEVICRENGLSVDQPGFDALMEKQRSLSVWNKGTDSQFVESVSKILEQKKFDIKFHGYDGLSAKGKCVALFDTAGKEVPKISAGAEGYAVFDETPFYAESGGQVGDKGTASEGSNRASVSSTVKIAKVIVHHVNVSEGALESGKSYTLSVDPGLRKRTAINHTATHMLHAALRNVLGDRVKQAGSLVDPYRLRFDFTYPRGVTPEEIQKIESQLNEEIRRSSSVSTKEMSYDDAIKHGALAFFDEKYGDKVRVITVAGSDKPFSIELCGGTHLSNTSEVGLFKVISETSVASGVRRIEALTSQGALEHLLHRDATLRDVELKLATKDDGVIKKIEQLNSDIRTLQKTSEDLRLKLAQGGGGGGQSGGKALYEKAKEIGGIRVVAETVPDADGKILRTLVDQIRDKLKDKTIVVLASSQNGKVSLCAGLTKDLVGVWDAGKLVKELAPSIGGTGGGRPDFAQAGGSDFAGVAAAFKKLESLVEQGPPGK